MANITVVFDIDDAIATAIQEDATTLEMNYPWISSFKKNGLYLEAICPHIIHPGVIELIQLLDKRHIRIAFYSSGDHSRNKPFVDKLLCHALGKIRFDEIKDHIVILSGKKETSEGNIETDLVPGNDRHQKQAKRYGRRFLGNWKKDLTKIATKDFELAWTVLLDNDFSFVMREQEKHILKVLTTVDADFSMICNRSETSPWDDEDKSLLKVNHIFYAAGLLFTAIKHAKELGITLAEALHQIQFKKNTLPVDERRFENSDFILEPLHEIKAYYEIGLQALREVNPLLSFLNLQASWNLPKPEIAPAEEKLGLDLTQEINPSELSQTKSLNKESIMLAFDIENVNFLGENAQGDLQIIFEDQQFSLIKKLETDLKDNGFSCHAETSRFISNQKVHYIIIKEISKDAFIQLVREKCKEKRCICSIS